jgi:hypothetical protein
MAGSQIQILYDVADASWKPHGKSLCHIVLSANHVTKTIFDIAKQRFVSLYSADMNGATPEAWTEFLSFVAAKEPDIKKVWFLSVPKTMLAPVVLFDEKMQDALLETHQKTEEGDSTASFLVKRLDAQLIFAYGGFFDDVKARFLINEFIPVDAAWLDCLYLNFKGTTGLHAHLNIGDGFISLAIFKDQNLQFYNTFHTATPEEILYFLMFVSEQLRLNPQRDPYYYSGNIKKGDETLALLSKYIKTLKPEERPAQFSYCMPMLDVPGHLFFNTYCTAICE